MKLLTIQNAKTTKGESLGYLTGILYLAPHTLSGVNLCPNASAGCASSCLNTAGRGRFSNVQKARLKKAQWFLNQRDTFFTQLRKDIDALIRKAKREGLKPCVRLNGTSDINFELAGQGIIDDYPSVQFYDYTKSIEKVKRVKRFKSQGKCLNYQLTFSASESNHLEVAEAIALGCNVAIVFRDDLPLDYHGRPVINGDDHDLRFLDGHAPDLCGMVIGLKAKGDAKKDQSGFVRDYVESPLDLPKVMKRIELAQQNSVSIPLH